MFRSFYNVKPVMRRLSAALWAAGLCGSALAAGPLCQAPDNLIRNPGFEVKAPGSAGVPKGWEFQSPRNTALGNWDAVESRSGRYSLRIDTLWNQPEDAGWLQSVDAPLHTPIYLSGWIKSDDVKSLQPDGPGATVSVLGRWDQPAATLGTTDWHHVGMSFLTDTSPLQVSARLGFWSGVATGTAWFDDLALVPLKPQLPHPSWKVLVLVYGETDAVITDANGVQRHVRSDATPAELDLVTEQARQFVVNDIPVLSSGNMLPSLTVRRASHPLNHLTLLTSTTDWWPAWGDTADEVHDPYDSVIIIWDSRVRDVAGGDAFKLGGPVALTRVATVVPIYNTLDLASAGLDGTRHALKQNWASAVQTHYQALQVLPEPAIDVNVDSVRSQYVNCKTGHHYLWQTESAEQPIPNSIWNNSSGFMHDLYSGQVARAGAHRSCLGLGPQVWAWGGPVTHSGSKPSFTSLQRLSDLLRQLNGLQTARMIDPLAAEGLISNLQDARWELNAHQPEQARVDLQHFNAWVEHWMSEGRLVQQAGKLLMSASKEADECMDQ
ncbi:MAG: hypothetical protein AB3X44_06350 [Leptothrix sp. (in: b-proteobacteria)]